MAVRNGQGLKVAVVGNEFGADRRAMPVVPKARAGGNGGGSVTGEALRAIEEEVREALRITLALPGDAATAALRGGQCGLAGLVDTEISADSRTVILRSAKAISRAVLVIDTLLTLKPVDRFAIKVVIFRALPRRKKWDEISREDPKSRQRWQLAQLQREVLVDLILALQNEK